MSGLQAEGMGWKGRFGQAAESRDWGKGIGWVLRSHEKFLAGSVGGMSKVAARVCGLEPDWGCWT